MTKKSNKTKYYLNIAKDVSIRSTCLKVRCGAVLVKDDNVIRSSCNGLLNKDINCVKLNKCNVSEINSSINYICKSCKTMHSEQNCITNVNKIDLLNADLYLYAFDIDNNKVIDDINFYQLNKKLLLSLGIRKVIFAKDKNTYDSIFTKMWEEHN